MSKDMVGRVCDKCGIRPAVVYQKHTGRFLCKDCFIEDIIDRVRREVEKWNMIRPGDTILLAVSGGKDSFVLLDIMPKIHDPSKLIALSIVEGIEGYNRAEDIEKMRKYALERGVDFIKTSFKEFVGASLDELVKRAWDRKLNVSPCTFCGTLRRRIMNYYARNLGVDKVATAHNLDDEVQTLLLNILRGDRTRLIQAHPKAPVLSTRIVRKIKPLRKIYEWETTMYAYLKDFKFQETECRYIYLRPTLRAKVRDHLYALEEEQPGTLIKILETMDEVLWKLIETHKDLPSLPVCKKCGEPTSYGRELCKICELLEKIGIY